MKHVAKPIAFWLCLVTGLLLIFIGSRFFLNPTGAETDFGIALDTHGDYSFHYIKGARDIFSGLILVVLLLTKNYRALAIVLLVSPIIPTTDLMVVLSHPGYQTGKLYPHLTAIVLGIGLGLYYLFATHTRGTHRHIEYELPIHFLTLIIKSAIPATNRFIRLTSQKHFLKSAPLYLLAAGNAYHLDG